MRELGHKLKTDIILLAMKESFCQDWGKNLGQLADGSICQRLTIDH